MSRDVTADKLTTQQKARAQRVDRSYHARPHPWRSMYKTLNWLLFLAAGLGMAALLYTKTGDNVYLPGAVSSKHAIFGHRCIECHESGPNGWGKVTDAKCLSCHDGPAHHLNMVHPGGHTMTVMRGGKPVQVQTATCASCHVEHKGHADLAATADRHCTQCHENLQVSDGGAKFFAKVTDFGTLDGHPEFRMFTDKEKDTTPLKYNHKAHMEVKWSDDQIKQRMGLEAGFKKVAGATLDCFDCHAPDAQRAYMAPVNFEMHCQMCHPLQLAPIANIGDVTLPHAQSDLVAAKVGAAFKDYLIKSGGKLPPKKVKNPKYKKPRPGQKPTEPEFIESPDDRPVEEWLNENVKATLEPMFKDSGTCAYCHEVNGKMPGTDLPLYVDPQVPRSWFPRNPAHAKSPKSVFFDHESHRVLQCTECHVQAAQSTTTADILIPSRDKCLKCHSPQGGARSGCVECHLYHDKSFSNFIGMRTILELEQGTDMGGVPAGKIVSRDVGGGEPDPAAKTEAKTEEAPAAKTEAAKTEAAPAGKTEAAKTEAAKTEAPAAAPAKSEGVGVQAGNSILCPNCSLRWPGKTKFCSRCGTQLQQ